MQCLALFDLDDTLINRRRALEAAVARLADRHHLGVDAYEAVLARLTERAGVEDFSVVRSRYGLAVSAEGLWQEYVADMAATSVCPDEVLDGLDELRARGWRVGVVTNGAADIQGAKLRATGIAPRVHGVCVSAELGFRKPDPRIFAAAAGRCGAAPERGGWMVGDDPVKDIVGGRSAGLGTLWISGTFDWPTVLPAPDRTAATALAAIRQLLDRSPGGGRSR
ncbi:HAD family hydrolase [Streptomyces sp. NPDC058662]|uniref:HAD family hydrolase n=1 Tax=Streptomyces sp. NPDC058662 TaxID=3346583 RepID=UPI003654A15E